MHQKRQSTAALQNVTVIPRSDHALAFWSAPVSGALQRTFPFKQGRMRVIKAAVERVRREIAQVFFAQFAQRLNQ